jgi:predicted RNA-binding Zn-ribbon protein involved in translation (DUF1610 family)
LFVNNACLECEVSVLKTKEFRVYDNRLLFKCPACGKRRNYNFPRVRSKTIRCDGCGAKTKCLFNRRPQLRQPQSGFLTLKTRDGKEIQVMMRDISSGGIGFEVTKGKDLRSIKRGQEISLTSSWNPRLIPKSRFKVQNIHGFRVGVMIKR